MKPIKTKLSSCVPGLHMVFLFAALFITSSCNEAKEEIKPARSFYMGFSPWPYDNTMEAVNWVYNKITSEGDIISEHMETGVPWPEAYAGDPFPQSFINDIQERVKRIGAGQKVLLQINCLNISRNGMAPYRGTEESMPLPEGWSNLKLNDPKVKTAYLNYAGRMIDYFHPQYVLLGVESNLLIRNNPALWLDYVELQAYVYGELKNKYPSVQLSLSVFCVPYFPEWSSEDNLEAQLKGLKDIEPYVDFLSFSVHPFMSGLLAEQFPENYFERLFNITTKPIAISESSYPAQKWETKNPPILKFNGTEDKQDRFLELMLTESEKAKAKFVIWFSIRDYDALWTHALGEDALSIIWRDTGLFGEAGNERKAFGTWKEWLSRGLE